MYHREFYKRKMITSMVASGFGADEDDDEDVCTVAGVCEMKNTKRAVHQLIGNIIHFGMQITVKALQEGSVVDVCTVYGLAINYEEKNTRLIK